MPESEAAAAGRACLDVAQQLVELDCAAIRYRHRRHQLDAAVCKIDRKIDSPCLGGFERWQHHAPFPQEPRVGDSESRWRFARIISHTCVESGA